MERVQSRTVELKQTARLVLTIAAIVLTLVQAWVVFAMVVLICRDWEILHQAKASDKNPQEGFRFE